MPSDPLPSLDESEGTRSPAHPATGAELDSGSGSGLDSRSVPEAAGVGSTSGDPSSALRDRVNTAEAAPLEDRAAAFSALHEELRIRLEAGARSDGGVGGTRGVAAGGGAGTGTGVGTGA